MRADVVFSSPVLISSAEKQNIVFSSRKDVRK